MVEKTIRTHHVNIQIPKETWTEEKGSSSLEGNAQKVKSGNTSLESIDWICLKIIFLSVLFSLGI